MKPSARRAKQRSRTAKRRVLTAAIKAEIKAARRAGATLEDLARRFKVSIGSVHNVLKSTDVPSPAPSTAAALAPAVDGDADHEVLNEIIAAVDTKLRGAAADDDITKLASLARVAATLREHRRKATPPATPDPNEQPDMIAAARHARERLHALVNNLARVSASPLADTIGRLLHDEPAKGSP